MAGERGMEARWLRLYKGIACTGFVAVLIPVVELLVQWSARQFSGMVALCLTPLLVGLGYGVQILFLGRSRRKMRETGMDFSFESRKFRLPVRNVLPALAVSTVIGGSVGSGIGGLLVGILQEECNRQIGIPLLLAVCVMLGVIGCLLVPFRFHQLLTLRTMLECVGVFGVLLGFYIWAGVSVSLLFVLCQMLYFLCFSVVMNQEYVIRHSYSSPTCNASSAVRSAGMRSACTLWLLAVSLLLPVLELATLLVTPFRVFLAVGRNPTFAELFCFPFPAFPILNAILFVLSVLTLISGAVLLLLRLRYRREEMREWRKRLLAAFRRIRKALLRRFLTPYRPKKKHDSGQKQRRESAPLHYVDTVTPIRPRDPDIACRDYRGFVRQMRRLPNIDEQFLFAYRVLIRTLCTEQKGIIITQTPSEMSKRISEHTNIASIDHLTDVFIHLTYARAERHASVSDLSALCEALQVYLPYNTISCAQCSAANTKTAPGFRHRMLF